MSEVDEKIEITDKDIKATQNYQMYWVLFIGELAVILLLATASVPMWAVLICIFLTICTLIAVCVNRPEKEIEEVLRIWHDDIGEPMEKFPTAARLANMTDEAWQNEVRHLRKRFEGMAQDVIMARNIQEKARVRFEKAREEYTWSRGLNEKENNRLFDMIKGLKEEFRIAEQRTQKTRKRYRGAYRLLVEGDNICTVIVEGIAKHHRSSDEFLVSMHNLMTPQSIR